MNLNEKRMFRKEWWNIKKYFLYRKIFNQFISKSKIHLDFGCGFGCIPYLLACDFPTMKVVGVDIDGKVLNLGKKRYKANNLKLLVSNEVNDKFDSISCSDVLHHIKNVEEYLKEFYSHLNSGGVIIIWEPRRVSKDKFRKVYYNPRLKEFKKLGIKLKPFESYYKHHSKWNIKEFNNMLKKAGFKTVKIKPEDGIGLFYIGKK